MAVQFQNIVETLAHLLVMVIKLAFELAPARPLPLDEAEQKRLVEKFYRCLNTNGYLFVGHAESLLGLTKKFQMVHKDSGTAYQRLEVRE